MWWKQSKKGKKALKVVFKVLKKIKFVNYIAALPKKPEEEWKKYLESTILHQKICWKLFREEICENI